MNIDEIPTPETDAHLNIYAYPEEAVHQNWADFARYLERRLTIARDEREDMGKLAHANACEAMEYRRLLTLARGTLIVIADESANLKHAERMADKALKQTAPKI